MTFYNDNLMCRLTDILNFPIYTRCAELRLLLERCDLRELTEVFPTVVKSIFGIDNNSLGWGLRTTTKENAVQSFTALFEFLHPLGPMFRVCYRLLNDAVKFDFSLELLPRKMITLMQSGASALFYGDLVNIDPLHRRVASLSLNAFDFFILHFTRHAIIPLHKQYPVALQVHNELLKSVYFFLSAEYLNAFLPGNPDVIILPANISSKIKTPQPLPVQPLQPKRSPKYLKVPSSSLYVANNSASTLSPTCRNLSPMECNTESPRANYWRTESVLNFFLDTWFRHDVDEARDLPSTDFIRVSRILVKQIHSFGNAACLDSTSMASMRKASQLMMKSRIYPFLKSLISRWPLDDSLSVVLELWFSYIQPWRYSYEAGNNSIPGQEIPIQKRYDSFIIDNLPIYTQIFIDVLARFERLDFTSMSNVNMLHRLSKVFSQSTLPYKLYQAEQSQSENSFTHSSPQKQSPLSRPNLSGSAINNSVYTEWENASYIEIAYIPLFSQAKTNEIQYFIRSIYISRLYVIEEIRKIKSEIEQIHKTYSLLKQLVLLIVKEELPLEKQLKQLLRIPLILENSIKSLGLTFNIEIPNTSDMQLENLLINSDEQSSISRHQQNRTVNSVFYSKNMSSSIDNCAKTIDPALIPIQQHECTFLVKSLHSVSCKINEKFGTSFESFWNRSDFLGKIARQILYPPMTTQWFDKPRGVTELFCDELPARVCLRPLASYRSLALIGLSFIIGHLIWSSPMLGLIYLFFLLVIYIIVIAIID